MYKLLHPPGFLLTIYGVSEGSYTVVLEDKMQLTERGYGVPPIVAANGSAISIWACRASTFILCCGSLIKRNIYPYPYP